MRHITIYIFGLFLTISCTIYGQKATENKQIGLLIFDLYKKELTDSMIHQFLPDKNSFKSIWDKAGWKTDEQTYKDINKDFKKITDGYSSKLKTDIEDYKNHDIKFDEIKIDSISTAYGKSDKVPNWDTEDLLYIKIYCHDNNQTFTFQLVPLYKFNGKWYLFETTIGFTQI